MIQHIKKYKNLYHGLISVMIPIILTWLLTQLHYSEIDGFIPTYIAVGFLAIFPARFLEWLQPRLGLGTDTWRGFFKNYAFTIITVGFCLLLSADNFFEVVKML